MSPSPLRRYVPALFVALSLGLGLSLSGIAHADDPKEVAPQDDYAADIQGNVPGASAIEGRLMAPCCWTQTIDIHDSEIALSMRHEIRRRLRNGESADAIQASFVERYGPKILAVQPNSQLKNVFIGLSVVMGGAGIAAAMMLGRWRKQTNDKRNAAPQPSEARDKWDDELDKELDDLN
jgi:cytochrome c-type biogenesis protein CcmH